MLNAPMLVVAISIVPLNDRRAVVIRGALHIHHLSAVHCANAHIAMADWLKTESLVRPIVRRPLVQLRAAFVCLARHIERLSALGRNDQVGIMRDLLESPVLVLRVSVIVLDNVGTITAGSALDVQNFTAVTRNDLVVLAVGVRVATVVAHFYCTLKL